MGPVHVAQFCGAGAQILVCLQRLVTVTYEVGQGEDKTANTCQERQGLVSSTENHVTYIYGISGLKVMLHWSTCNANLQRYDVARKVVLV